MILMQQNMSRWNNAKKILQVIFSWKTMGELFSWFLISIVLPITIPIGFYYVAAVIVRIENIDIGNVLNVLFLVNGVYLFFGITLLLDLFHEHRYEPVRKLFHPLFYIPIIGILVFSLAFFICSLGVIPKDYGHPLKDHAQNIYNFFISIIILVTIAKLVIISLKNYQPQTNG